jgi:tungstate transport system substrate-binding protein
VRTLGIVIVLVLAALAAVWHLEERDAPEASQRVRLATTTSTANSGLLEWLREVFEPQSGLEVQVVAVGTGEAIERAKRGDADLVLVHAREREDEFVESGHGVDRRDVMWNDFVILGPPEDPAGIRGVADPAAAMVQVLERGATFVSRGDDSGTHIREKALWKRAGFDPMTREETYLRAGAGMGKCLEMADQKRAYLLADRGTYAAFKARLDLAVLVEGHESLRNPYGIILVNPQRHPHVNAEGARRFHEWVTSPEGQARIGAFEVDGEVLFHAVTRE